MINLQNLKLKLGSFARFALLLILIYLIAWIKQLNNYLDDSYKPIRKTNGDLHFDSNVQRNNFKKNQIFCIILTSKNSIYTKGKIIYQTWAKSCDNFKFILKIPDDVKKNAMNFSDFSYNKNDAFEVFNMLEPPEFEKDEYGILTDKLFVTLKYIYRKYNYYDWYLKADDDTFIFVENLRNFVSNKNPLLPVTYGYDFKLYVEKGYHSGGAGYLLSNEALRRIGSKLNYDLSFCANSGIEDVDVAKCLRKLDVYPNKSLDFLGRERFHPYSISMHYNGDYPLEFLRYSSNVVQKVICI